MTIRLATRRSPLALKQADYVASRLRELGEDCELVPTETRGDRERAASLSEIGGQGVFALEVQLAVRDGRADVAVHSAKDLPSDTPAGLVLCCVPERRDAADVLVGRALAGLGPGATVATGSPRRRAMLLERRPDLNVVNLRGNMASRLGVAGRDGVDAIVTAMAALDRLEQMDLVAERLDPRWFVPQVGQGALALEARDDDDATRRVLERVGNDVAYRTLMAERAYLRELGAGCALPVGAYATLAEDQLELHGVMLSPDGTRSVRATRRGYDAEQLGVELARHLRDERGGGDLVAEAT